MAQIPQAFLTAMSGNTEAMTRFCGLTDVEKDAVVRRAGQAASQQELYEIITRL